MKLPIWFNIGFIKRAFDRWCWRQQAIQEREAKLMKRIAKRDFINQGK